MKPRTWLGVTVLILLAGWIQASWLSHAAYRGEWPDLCLTIVVLLPLLHGAEVGLLGGVVAGLYMGLAVGTAAPAFFLSRVVTGAGADTLRARWHSANPLVQAGAVVLGTLFCEVVFAIFHPAVLAQDWSARVLLRAALNGAVAPLVGGLLRRLRLADPEEVR